MLNNRNPWVLMNRYRHHIIKTIEHILKVTPSMTQKRILITYEKVSYDEEGNEYQEKQIDF